MKPIELLALFSTCFPGALHATDARVVENPSQGVWDQSPRKVFGLLEEMFLGGDDPNSDVVLGRVSDIAVDSRGRMLILDSGFGHVTIYDPDSLTVRTLGRKGEGPGEFNQPTAIGVDAQDRIYVASMGGRVVIFAPDGGVVGEFRQEFAGQPVYDLSPISSGLYIVCLDPVADKLVHFYDSKHKHVSSFSNSRSAVVPMRPDEKGWGNGGRIDVGADGNVYFTQFTPYEIRKFSPDGELLLTIHRDNDFMKPPRIERQGDGAAFYAYSGSSGIVALGDGKIMNVVAVVDDQHRPSSTIVDLFDADGRLLKSLKLGRRVYVRCRDAQDRIYASEEREVPQVVRYRLGFK